MAKGKERKEGTTKSGVGNRKADQEGYRKEHQGGKDNHKRKEEGKERKGQKKGRRRFSLTLTYLILSDSFSFCLFFFS